MGAGGGLALRSASPSSPIWMLLAPSPVITREVTEVGGCLPGGRGCRACVPGVIDTEPAAWLPIWSSGS
jgi:hypothetical protein